MNPTLHQIDDDNQVVRSWPIVADAIRIGRDLQRMQHREVVLSDDNYVSQIHAQITLRPDGEPVWFLEDLGSTNGTLVNGVKRHGLTRLQHGDIIQVGRTRLLFHWETRELVES